MHKIKKHIRSSKPAPNDANADFPAPYSPASQTRHAAFDIINTTTDKEFQNMIATDLPGHYPITSLLGHKYLFVMFDTDSNFINTVPIKNNPTPELIKGFKHCHKYLKKRHFYAKLLPLDNKVSKDRIAHIEAEQLMYQLASPGDHCTNPAERAIQTFKNHFIGIISGTNPEFPSNCWDPLSPPCPPGCRHIESTMAVKNQSSPHSPSGNIIIRQNLTGSLRSP